MAAMADAARLRRATTHRVAHRATAAEAVVTAHPAVADITAHRAVAGTTVRRVVEADTLAAAEVDTPVPGVVAIQVVAVVMADIAKRSSLYAMAATGLLYMK